MNACQKGKRGERLWRDKLREFGFDARRGRQFSGSPESPDVVCVELDDRFHFEVKFVENLSIFKAMEQAIRDAVSKTPTVAHKKNNTEFLVTMRADDWLKLIKEWHEQKKQLEVVLGTCE